MYFIGKGGVGKSTLSVLTAIQLAVKNHPTRLVSLDPAHNLSDILDLKLSTEPKQVQKNLTAQEVDMEGWIQRYLKRIEQQLQSSYRYLSSFNLDKQFAAVKLAPGMEEYGMLLAMHQILFNSRNFEYIIVDMPPTGLALRFFNLPRLSMLWLEKLLELRKVILQRKEIVHKIRLGPLDMERDKLSAQLKQQLQFYTEIIRFWQSSQTIFYVVLNQDTLSENEAKRILSHLDSEGFRSVRIIVNKCDSENAFDICGEFSQFKCFMLNKTKYPLFGLKNLKQFLEETEFFIQE